MKLSPTLLALAALLAFAGLAPAAARSMPAIPARPTLPSRGLLADGRPGGYGSPAPGGSYGAAVGPVAVRQTSAAGSPVTFSVEAENAAGFATRCWASPFSSNPLTITYGAVSPSGAASMDILGAFDDTVYNCNIYGTRGTAAGPATPFRFSPTPLSSAIEYQTVGKTTAFLQLVAASSFPDQEFHAECRSETEGAAVSVRVAWPAPDAADVHLFGMTPGADYACDFWVERRSGGHGPVVSTKFTALPADVPEQPLLLSVAPGPRGVEIVASGTKVVPGQAPTTYTALCKAPAAPDAVAPATVAVGESTLTVKTSSLPGSTTIMCSITPANAAGAGQPLDVTFETGASLPAPVAIESVAPAKTTATVKTTATGAASYDVACAPTDFAVDAPSSTFAAEGTDTSAVFRVADLLPATVYACTVTSRAPGGARGGRAVAYVETSA